MWPALVIALSAGAAFLHLRWSRRCEALARSVDRLKQDARESAAAHEADIARSHAEQAVLFESMTEGVIVLDASSRIQVANAAVRQLLDVSKDIRGQTVLEAFRLGDLHALVERVRVEKAGGSLEIELPGLSVRTLEVNVAVVLSPDRRLVQAVILVFHDLTRLNELEHTRQEFVANVSHELRTPLSLIKGYVETLIEGAKDDPAVASKFLHTILKHTDRLTYLIEDLLILSKLESGREALNFQREEFRPLVERVVDELQTAADSRQIGLVNEVPTELKVRMDVNRMHQVLLNLMDNGIKYGRTGGVVTVTAREVGEQLVEVEVQDNGQGIPVEAQDRVFERFFRAEKARSREQGGTGLGLSIVKHIVLSHGGKVWVTSEMGRGSTFYFTLQGGSHGGEAATYS
ncbi:MAG: PAS domain-containing protein [Pedosphaera sp.]|nr:PAS domain-containing protein [Pedosphaera sp.]